MRLGKTNRRTCRERRTSLPHGIVYIMHREYYVDDDDDDEIEDVSLERLLRLARSVTAGWTFSDLLRRSYDLRCISTECPM